LFDFHVAAGAAKRVSPKPFRGPLDAVRRMLSEQYYKFPRFVLTGAWLRAWRGAT
jgi:hypothetical protein